MKTQTSTERGPLFCRGPTVDVRVPRSLIVICPHSVAFVRLHIEAARSLNKCQPPRPGQLFLTARNGHKINTGGGQARRSPDARLLALLTLCVVCARPHWQDKQFSGDHLTPASTLPAFLNHPHHILHGDYFLSRWLSFCQLYVAPPTLSITGVTGVTGVNCSWSQRWKEKNNQMRNMQACGTCRVVGRLTGEDTPR
ncbi:hypothetical protein C0Q70_11227 [Pomacea canaliculata]|uniref:Uncharacterized protein n=1 Tax=Pomacea canaliculata TaxID=400727 RepID=A0A2T7P5G1_POMCA|nr:hypothetical protein C0Q70_11227 [Pomacea canaliculata]